jgi:nucleotide-binding universal stress UspA family protein
MRFTPMARSNSDRLLECGVLTSHARPHGPILAPVRLARILVGDDGSRDAASATTWAQALADVAGAAVTVAHVSGGPRDALDTPPAGPTWELAGHPAEALLAAADEIEADLIVVGRRGAGGFGALRLGSVAHQVAEHTTRPLAVVPRPPDTTEWRFADIAVGLDGSPAGAGALLWVKEIAVVAAAKVHVVHALELGPAFAAAAMDAAYEQSRARVITEIEVVWTAPLRDAGVEHSIHVEDAGPAGVLLEAALARGVDLVVVGRRGPTSFPGMEMGSVAHRVLGFAPCPVVVVPQAR